MPFVGEHAAKLLNPDIEHARVRRTKGSGEGTVQGVKVPSSISIIWFIAKSDVSEVPRAQSLRFPVSSWTEAKANEWLKDNKIKSLQFEDAEAEGQGLCYKYENKEDDVLNIVLHKNIGFTDDVSSEAFYNLLTPDIKTINLDLNSKGGFVSDGLSIYNQLKDHPAQVNVKITGQASSIASVVAMAGDNIEMPDASYMMIHKPLVQKITGPNADDLRKTADALDVMEEAIILAYQTRMDKTKEEIAGLMREEKWLIASEARELGLADNVTDEEVDILTYHDYSEFNNAPLQAVNLYSLDADHEIPEIEKEELNFVSKLKKYFNIPNFEEDDMSSEKEKELTTQLETANSDKDAALAKVTTLETENKTLKDAQENAVKAKAEAVNKVFLAEMVKEGRVRPVDEAMHLENMVSKDEKGLESYMNWLKEFPTVVDVSGNHLATKETTVEIDVVMKDGLTEEVNKIMAEKKCDHLEALDIVKMTKPELCN